MISQYLSASQKKADLEQVLSKLRRSNLIPVEIARDFQGTATTITHATFKSEPLKAA